MVPSFSRGRSDLADSAQRKVRNVREQAGDTGFAFVLGLLHLLRNPIPLAHDFLQVLHGRYDLTVHLVEEFRRALPVPIASSELFDHFVQLPNRLLGRRFLRPKRAFDVLESVEIELDDKYGHCTTSWRLAYGFDASRGDGFCAFLGTVRGSGCPEPDSGPGRGC